MEALEVAVDSLLPELCLSEPSPFQRPVGGFP